MNSEIISAWSAAFAESIESLRIEIFDAVIYDAAVQYQQRIEKKQSRNGTGE